MRYFRLPVILFVLIPSSIFAEWSMDIRGVRLKSKPFVTIGMAAEMNKVETAPAPPGYQCDMFVSDPEFPDDHLKTDIRPNHFQQEWILSIDPHGQDEPVPKSCSVSWNPSDLGQGYFQIIDASSHPVIYDMKHDSSFTVTGIQKYQHFRIRHKQFLSLFDIIAALQLLTAAPINQNAFFEDIDGDRQISQKDILSMLQSISQLN